MNTEPISDNDMASALVYGGALVRAFHAAYEDLAPDWNYETKLETRVPFDELPDDNKGLMLAVGMRVWHQEVAPRIRREVNKAIREVDELRADLKSATASYREALDAALTFAEQHGRFHPDFWCASRPDEHCYACDFGAAITRLLPQ